MTEIINNRYLYLRMFYCYISKEKSFTFIYIYIQECFTLILLIKKICFVIIATTTLVMGQELSSRLVGS